MARALMLLFITPAFEGLRTSIYTVLISASKLISVSFCDVEVRLRLTIALRRQYIIMLEPYYLLFYFLCNVYFTL